MKTKQFYLIDATAFCYRAFHALKGLSTSFGQPTNAIYGFTNILNKLLKSSPDYLAACFDVSRDTFRAKKFAQYKVQRPAMPDELSSQIPFIKEILRAYGIPIFEKEGFEADDLIATLACKARKKNISVTVVSSDKDILQLVDEHTKVFSPYKDEGVTYDRKAVIERYGVEPEKIADIIALMGDDADNIPGVPGVGEKTASQLIQDFGTAEKLLKSLDKIPQEKLKASLLANREMVLLNKELAQLNSEVDVEFDPEELKKREPDSDALFKLFKYLEFKSMLKALPAQEEPQGHPAQVEEISDSEAGKRVSPGSTLYLFGDSFESLVFYAGDGYFRVKPPGDGLKRILADEAIKKAGYDLKKIKVKLAQEGVSLCGLYFDVMLAAYLLNPSRAGFSLQDIALDHLEKSEPALIDTERALKIIVELEPVLEKELKSKELFRLFSELEMPLASVLAEMELNGVTLDKGLLKEVSRDVEARLINLIEQIYKESQTQFNINSPKQLREILFERLKLPVVKKSKTGPSTDEEVLRKLAGKHPLPALLLDYRQLMKLKTTYIDTLPELIDKKTGKIHSSFNQTGTETGRLSSSNPNLQNIPVKTDTAGRIRQAFVASGKDRLLVACDYSQIELRILAHLSKDSHLISAFKDDADIHRATASLIYGLEEKDVQPAMRETAKRVNFGIVYGLTSFGLSRDLGIGTEEAQSFIDAYFLRYPGVKEYIETQIAFAKKHGFVTTILGRRRYIPEINNKNLGIRQFAERKAINTPIQGSASDLIKLAMIDIHNKLASSGMKSLMVMQIHDELIFDVPESELKDLVGLAKEVMEGVLKLDVPVKVDVKQGRNWLEMEAVD